MIWLTYKNSKPMPSNPILFSHSKITNPPSTHIVHTFILQTLINFPLFSLPPRLDLTAKQIPSPLQIQNTKHGMKRHAHQHDIVHSATLLAQPLPQSKDGKE
mmetsp:Transcript_11007/g.15955  ORF Transcript_11007/g.15955 Transcript_11007/m.15955 type:complete len:102 (-) Transcript_11007:802-1107(-)